MIPVGNQEITTFGIVVAASFIAALAVLWLGFKLIGRSERSGRLEQLSGRDPEGPRVRQTMQQIFMEDAEKAKGVLANMKLFRGLRYKIEGAGMDWTVETFLTNVLISIGLGLLLGFLFPLGGAVKFSMVFYALAASTVPWIVLGYKHSKRMRQLEEQLPEALDFIARGIRAGHAFSVALEMLASEGPEPIRTEFRKVHMQISLGGDLETALRNLVARVPIVDVRFFASAVLLQRETGGNLSEMLTNVANTVRERMRLRGQIRAATAHGRMTAGILTVIPVVIGLFMMKNSPESMKIFLENPTGRLLGIWAIVSQVLGYLVIRKMINFKV
jgi:tight adherence protein B